MLYILIIVLMIVLGDVVVRVLKELLVIVVLEFLEVDIK